MCCYYDCTVHLAYPCVKILKVNLQIATAQNLLLYTVFFSLFGFYFSLGHVSNCTHHYMNYTVLHCTVLYYNVHIQNTHVETCVVNDTVHTLG